MNELRRLRDDPDFLRETGCDIRDEVAALQPADLPALRARILAGTAPVPPRPRAWGWMGGGAAILVAAGLLWWWSAAAGPDPHVVAAGPAATHGVASPSGSRAPTPPDDGGATPAPSNAPAAVSASGSARARAAATRVPPPAASEAVAGGGAAEASVLSVPVADAPPAGAVVPDEGGETPPLVGDLAAQHAAFEAAEEALAAGDGARARDLYDAYLARWPDGAFTPEARLGALWSEVKQGNADEVDPLAEALAADPTFAPRREELLFVRAGALVTLGRCGEALAIAEALPRAEAARVRRSCR